MGPTLKGYDKIVKFPTGCGEQNMVNFAPNICVMKYLNSTNLEVDKIFNKAKGFLENGKSHMWVSILHFFTDRIFLNAREWALSLFNSHV